MNTSSSRLGSLVLLTTLGLGVAEAGSPVERVSSQLSRVGLSPARLDLGDVSKRLRILDTLNRSDEYGTANSGAEATYARTGGEDGPLTMYSSTGSVDTGVREPNELTLAFAQVAAEVLNPAQGLGTPLGRIPFTGEDFLGLLDRKYSGEWVGPASRQRLSGGADLTRWSALKKPIGFPVEPERARGFQLSTSEWNPFGISPNGGSDLTPYERSNWLFATQIADFDFETDYVLAGGQSLHPHNLDFAPSVALRWVADIDVEGATQLTVEVQFPETACRAEKLREAVTKHSGCETSRRYTSDAFCRFLKIAPVDPVGFARAFSAENPGYYKMIAGNYAGPQGCGPQQYSFIYPTASEANPLLALAEVALNEK